MIEPKPFLLQSGHDVRAGLVASTVSIVWTALAGATAIVLGITSGSVVLVAFGAVGVFDLAGSVALVVHFRHALHHEAISARHERIAHLVVSYGLLTVAVATLIGSGIRLADAAAAPDEPIAGLVTSGASVLVLAYLGTVKRRIGGRIPSRALTTDGWLSLTGSATALCAVGGLALNDAFGWAWVDPVAAMCIAVIAVGIAIFSIRGGD